MINIEKLELDIQHDPSAKRFTLPVPGLGDAVLEYRIIEREDVDVIDFTHTFVPQEARHQGIGGTLVKRGLHYAQEKGYQVRGSCPFVENFLDEHPEYDALRDRPPF